MSLQVVCCRDTVTTLRLRLLLLALLSFAGFGAAPAFAQPDLVITQISVRPLSAAANIRGQWRYAALFNVRVANVGIDASILSVARPVTVHLQIARVLSSTSRLSYVPLPIYTCDYARVLDCGSYASYVQDNEGIPRPSSKLYPIIAQVTGQPRDWANPRQPLQGSADITWDDLLPFDVNVDRSRLLPGCAGRVYCYSIIGVVNKDNPARETRAARSNNIFIGQVVLPPQRLRPLGP